MVRNGARRSIYVLTVVCASFLTASCVGAQKPEDRDKKPVVTPNDSTFELGERALPGRVVLIDLGTGGTLAVRAWDRDSVRLRVKFAGRDWSGSKVHLDHTPAGVRLRSNLGGSPLEKSTSHEFVLWVPRKSDIELQSLGGNVHITGVIGRFTGRTGGGAIELDHVSGYANLSTRGGPIIISDSHLDGTVTTRGGTVEKTRVTGNVRATVEN
ncbi:MAG TPA: hypothetical protein VJ865_07820 [Gemmatimonadaceae bacterium]|nr:hypothetical protein [Gemmatimonadaceae bacterium]